MGQNIGAKVTISRRGMCKGDGEFCISITDASSGILVAEVNMELAEFAECIGGLSSCNGTFKFRADEHTVDKYGKVREAERISIETKLDKHSDKEGLLKLIKASVPEGWVLSDDGMRTQQNQRGRHQFVVCRFVDKVDDRERF